MKTPSADDLNFAAEWLRQYDDEHDGGADMARAAAIADWLDAQANAIEQRAIAKEQGVPVAIVRRVMRDREGRDQ